jgi:uncharacterized protein (TIGR03118 family)
MGSPFCLDGKFSAFRAVLASLLLCASLPAKAAPYLVTFLASDQSGTAPNIDPHLQNPWGLSYSPTGPFWAADEHTGFSTVYAGSGSPQSLVVTIPPAPGHSRGTPTGTVFNPSSDFHVLGSRALFVFATEDGTISGWNSAAGTSAVIAVDNSASHANYKGLEFGNNGTGNFLYAANFFAGTVDAFDKNFQPAVLAGSFTDPNLPAGYAPFNIIRSGTRLLVAYGKQNASKTNALFCAGCGFVDIFDLNGNFKKRFASQGMLNAPWGLAVAPATFGTFSSDILVANLGDGRINAFSPAGVFLGQLLNAAAKPIVLGGLWAIKFGNGGMGGLKTELFFVSGPGGYAHGRFGKITSQ